MNQLFLKDGVIIKMLADSDHILPPAQLSDCIPVYSVTCWKMLVWFCKPIVHVQSSIQNFLFLH